jgi:Asp-tRNA(Asn)/Glu-tRNA(Gln) amidotransferase C subunit
LFKYIKSLPKFGRLFFESKIKDMSKIMTVDILSSIKGAKPSDSVNQLFDVIKNANKNTALNTVLANVLSLDDLRPDEVVESSAIEKQIIKENFPREKNGFLVVAKVIED